MKFETNRQRLESFTDEELAIFLCHIIQSDELTMVDLSAVQAKYKDSKPTNFDSTVMWLKGPAH